ncbi:DUF3885 domain-containing protein [Catenulispora subtropica]|uniref:DUF3885 domain-containing protein n=1 Tax=Catenulispora subtropica TaxID=450798 RepID=UPI0031D947D8
MSTEAQRGSAVSATLSTVWRERFGDRAPVAHELPARFPERWVRFHSLPGSKRYATDAFERATVLHRHYLVLTELFAGREVFILTSTFSGAPHPPPRTRFDVRINPGAVRWRSFLSSEGTDPEFIAFTHVYAAYTPWRDGSLDRLLSAAAQWRTANVMIADGGLERLYHPYDGGADVLLADSVERNVLRDRHADWLSVHPSGM